MATLVKISKQEQAAQARQDYIHSAEVSLHGSYAEVRGQADSKETYRVEIEGGVPVSCVCPDFYYRSRRDPQHICKHEEAVSICLAATLPMIGTAEMAKLIKSAEKIFKQPRRSTPNAQLIASLQLPEGTKVCKIAKKNANAFVLVCPPVVTLLSPVCLPMAA